MNYSSKFLSLLMASLLFGVAGSQDVDWPPHEEHDELSDVLENPHINDESIEAQRSELAICLEGCRHTCEGAGEQRKCMFLNEHPLRCINSLNPHDCMRHCLQDCECMKLCNQECEEERQCQGSQCPPLSRDCEEDCAMPICSYELGNLVLVLKPQE